MPSGELLTTNRKAITVNLDEAKYGTFAEIGAGQEVARYFFQAGGALPAEVFINATNLQVALHLRNLYAHLLENHYLEGLVGYNPALSDIFSRDVLVKIQQGDSGWEKMVPPKVAEMIKQRRLFGWQPPAVPNLPEVPAWY